MAHSRGPCTGKKRINFTEGSVNRITFEAGVSEVGCIIDYSDSWGSSTVISCNKQVSADRIPFEVSITTFW